MSSELRVNKLTSRSGVGTVTFNDSGLIITGIATAATLDITGNATIAGVLSYDDVTNVDSVGLVTARSGIKVGATGSNTLISGTATGIGIGTESPDRKLEVVNDNDYALKVGGNTAGGYYLELGQTGTNGSAGIKYSGSGGSLKISNSSGEIARFDPSGNMGIGENSPDVRLHVKETINSAYSLTNVTTDANHLLKLENPSTTANAFAGIQFRTGNGADMYFGAIQQSANDGDFFFANQNSPNVEIMRIKSTGNIGIGTDNPSGTLTVYGDSSSSFRISKSGVLAYDHTFNGSTYTIANNNGSAGIPIVIGTKTAGGESLRITAAGRVGINRPSPGGVLDVQGTGDDLVRFQSTSGAMTQRLVSADGSLAKLEFTDSSAYRGKIQAETDDSLTFYTGGVSSEKVRITSAGNFGIGVTPNVKLQVKLDTDKHLYFQGNIGEIGNVPGIQGVTDAGALASLGLRGNDLRFATGNAERMRIDSAGKLGLGTNSPKRQLHIHGGNETVKIQITNTTTGSSTDGDGFQIAIAANGDAYLEQRENSPLIFSTNNTERMRIDSSGKVIIGTNTAATNQKLTIRATEPEMALYATPGSSSILNMGDTDNYQIGRILYQNGDNSMRFYTNVSERMRIDSSGQVLIGETSSGGACKLGMSFGNATGNYMELGGTQRSANGLNKIFVFRHGYWGGSQEVASMGVLTNSSSGGAGNGYAALTFQTGTSGNGDGGSTSTERMRITNGGEVMMGTTSRLDSNAVRLTVKGPFPTTPIEVQQDTSNTHYMMTFRNSNGLVGHITATGSSCSFTNASDYRLKENVVGITDGITRVKQLQPKRFNFIADADTTVDGFLAHEAQSVVPESVIGTKDQVEVWRETDELPEGVSVGDNKLDDEGNTIPVMQGIDTSKLVPLLTAALQEAIAEIESLKARVTTLEG